MNMKILDYALISLLAGVSPTVMAQQSLQDATRTQSPATLERIGDLKEQIAQLQRTQESLLQKLAQLQRAQETAQVPRPQPKAQPSDGELQFNLRTRSHDQPVTQGASPRSSSKQLQPDRHVVNEADQRRKAMAQLPGTAVTTGKSSITLPRGGVVRTTEDPSPGQPELSMSAPSMVPFDDQQSRSFAVELTPDSTGSTAGEIAAASDTSARDDSRPASESGSAWHTQAGSARHQALVLSLPALGEPVEGWQGPQPASARLIQLPGTVAAALLQSSTVRSAMADLALSGAEVRIARSGYYPTLQSSAGTGGVDNFDAELSLSQPLYDFGRTSARVSQTRAGRESAEAALWAAREKAAYEAATAFIAVKRMTELVEAAEDNVHAHERVAELARIRTDGGVGDATEKGLAGVRLGESVSAREDARGNLRIARNRYANKVGAEPPEVLGDVPNLPLLFRTESSLEALVHQAPTVESARARERSALAGARFQKAELFPRLEAVAYARTYNHMDKVDTGIGIRLVGPTFTGLSSFERVQAAGLLAESARWQAETARRDVVLRIRDLIERTPTLEEQLAILEAQLKEAVVLRDLYEDQFKLGRRSLVDFLNIQADIHRIARTQVNTLYDLFELQYAAAEGLGRLQVSLAIDTADNVGEKSP